MITLSNISMRYENFLALQPTSLSLRKGQFTVLLGASGAGKSTLLRCLNFLNEPTTGTIETSEIGSLDTKRKQRLHRRQTGMVFQQHQLIGRLTALRNVLMGRIAYHSTLRSLLPLSKDEQAIGLHALERVGLLEKALSRVDQLSGGQQQRVGIARALAQQPRMILADEPVASLDPATADKVMTLLHRICKEDGISAVVSLHQVDLAKRYADRIIGLSHGNVVFDAVPHVLTSVDLDRLYRPIAPNVEYVTRPRRIPLPITPTPISA